MLSRLGAPMRRDNLHRRYGPYFRRAKSLRPLPPGNKPNAWRSITVCPRASSPRGPCRRTSPDPSLLHKQNATEPCWEWIPLKFARYKAVHHHLSQLGLAWEPHDSMFCSEGAKVSAALLMRLGQFLSAVAQLRTQKPRRRPMEGVLSEWILAETLDPGGWKTSGRFVPLVVVNPLPAVGQG